jgi:hypothetical protein
MEEKKEKVLQFIRQLLIENDLSANDVVLLCEQLKLEAIISIASAKEDDS